VIEAVVIGAGRAVLGVSHALGFRLNRVHQMMIAAIATAEAKLMANLS
jgi:hypothetical protein